MADLEVKDPRGPPAWRTFSYLGAGVGRISSSISAFVELEPPISSRRHFPSSCTWELRCRLLAEGRREAIFLSWPPPVSSAR